MCDWDELRRSCAKKFRKTLDYLGADMPSMKDSIADYSHMYQGNAPDTSRLAAARIHSRVSHIQERILVFLKNCPAGATDYDIQQAFDDHSSTFRSRRAELVNMGRVRDSGARKTQNGSKRIVWEYVL